MPPMRTPPAFALLRTLCTRSATRRRAPRRLRATRVSVTPRQALRIALTHPPADLGRSSYSTTDHVLLGLIVEQVTGHSYAVEAERRLIAPLGPTDTSFPGSRTSLPRRTAAPARPAVPTRRQATAARHRALSSSQASPAARILSSASTRDGRGAPR